MNKTLLVVRLVWRVHVPAEPYGVPHRFDFDTEADALSCCVEAMASGFDVVGPERLEIISEHTSLT